MKRLIFVVACLGMLVFSNQLKASDAQAGKDLFRLNCKACHHLDMRLVGPPLRGVTERREEDWLLSFIKSSTTMIQSGDATAVELFNTYNKVLMPDQNLSEAEIRDILTYVSQPAAGSDAPFPRPEVMVSNARPLAFSDYRFWIMYTIIVVLVVAVVYLKADITSLEKEVHQRN